MLCVISGGNWDNGSNAGVWALNLNNVRGNSNPNIGFRADPLPATPHAATAARQRGSYRRGWCRNVLLPRPLVSGPGLVAGPEKIGAVAPSNKAAA